MKISRAAAVLIFLLLSLSFALLLDHLVHCDSDDTDCLVCLTLSSLFVPSVAVFLLYSIEQLFAPKTDGEIRYSHSLSEHGCRAPPTRILGRG